MHRLLLGILLGMALPVAAQVADSTLFRQARVADGVSVTINRTSDAAGATYTSSTSFQPQWDPTKVTATTPPPFRICQPVPLVAPPNVACRAWLKEAYLAPLRTCGFDAEP